MPLTKARCIGRSTVTCTLDPPPASLTLILALNIEPSAEPLRSLSLNAQVYLLSNFLRSRSFVNMLVRRLKLSSALSLVCFSILIDGIGYNHNASPIPCLVLFRRAKTWHSSRLWHF